MGLRPCAATTSSAVSTMAAAPSASTNPRRSMLKGREAWPGWSNARSVLRSLKLAFMLAKPSTISEHQRHLRAAHDREVHVAVADHARADGDGVVARRTCTLGRKDGAGEAQHRPRLSRGNIGADIRQQKRADAVGADTLKARGRPRAGCPSRYGRTHQTGGAWRDLGGSWRALRARARPGRPRWFQARRRRSSCAAPWACQRRSLCDPDRDLAHNHREARRGAHGTTR